MTRSTWITAMAAEDLPGDHTGGPSQVSPRDSTALPRRILLRRSEAADALAMSIDSFERYVEPSIKLVIKGPLRLVPYAELERYVSETSQSVGGVL
jgi:hypothetical protein